MKERPILFSAPMVRAILAGTKRQTRRVVKPQPHDPAAGLYGEPAMIHGTGSYTQDHMFADGFDGGTCPYGQPGDRLWVREAFRLLDVFDAASPSAVGELCLSAGYLKPWAPIQYEADASRDNWMHVGPHDGGPAEAGKLRVGIHMPRWASRILLEIVGVRVERLQDISEADAIAEGVTTIWPDGPRADGGPNHYTIKVDHGSYNAPTAVGVYAMLWESINGPGSWDANPWVWVVEFKRLIHA